MLNHATHNQVLMAFQFVKINKVALFIFLIFFQGVSLSEEKPNWILGEKNPKDLEIVEKQLQLKNKVHFVFINKLKKISVYRVIIKSPPFNTDEILSVDGAKFSKAELDFMKKAIYFEAFLVSETKNQKQFKIDKKCQVHPVHCVAFDTIYDYFYFQNNKLVGGNQIRDYIKKNMPDSMSSFEKLISDLKIYKP